MKVKTIIHLFTILFILAFAPHENMVLLFHLDEYKYYGEFLLYQDTNNIFILAKNNSIKPAKICYNEKQLILTKSICLDNYSKQVDSLFIYPSSYALIASHYDSLAYLNRHIQFGDEQPTRPEELYIMTYSEKELGYIFIVALILLSGYLCYLINEFNHRSSYLS